MLFVGGLVKTKTLLVHVIVVLGGLIDHLTIPGLNGLDENFLGCCGIDKWFGLNHCFSQVKR